MTYSTTRRLLPLFVALFIAAPVYGGLIEPDLHASDGLQSAPFVLGPTSPGKWGPVAFGTSATVTWSLMPSGTSCAGIFVGCTVTDLASTMPAGFLTEIVAAFAIWSAVADITFIMAPDDGAPWNTPTTSGDIRLGALPIDGPGSTLAQGFFPPVNSVSAAGDIFFDTAELWKIGFGGAGFDIFQVAAHEIGHAIGLDHTLVPASLMNAFYTEAFSGPQADDKAGVQFIYGPSTLIPEPSTVMLFGIGLVGLLALKRQRAI